MLTKPPLYSNTKTINAIAGPDYDNLKKHAKIYFSTNDPDLREKRLAKEFKSEKRERLGEIYKELKENGIYITGITPDGRLKIAHVVINDPKYQIDKSKSSRTLSQEKNLRRIQEIKRRLKGFGDADYSTSSQAYEPNFEELEEVPF